MASVHTYDICVPNTHLRMQSAFTDRLAFRFTIGLGRRTKQEWKRKKGQGKDRKGGSKETIKQGRDRLRVVRITLHISTAAAPFTAEAQGRTFPS